MNENDQLFLIRLGELSLKGLNRDFFEKRLKNNIKSKLKGYRTHVITQKGRFFLEVEAACPVSVVESALSTTFGLVGFSKCLKVDKSEEAIRGRHAP